MSPVPFFSRGAGATLSRRASLGLLAGTVLPAGVWAAAPAFDLWPRAALVPGGVARLVLGPAAQRPQVRFGEASVLVMGDPIAWTALVGIPLATAPGEAAVEVLAAVGEGAHRVPFQVGTKRYAEQRLTVPPRTVDLSPADEARYQRERACLLYTSPSPRD